MKFTEALREMKEGKKVKLPSWGGYWYWDKEKQTVMIQCRPQDSDQGELFDIRETQRVEYTLSNVASDEWIIADEMNCPVLGGEATFSFGDAIKYVKRGLKLKRKGWNGKKQYIQLAIGISYKDASGDIINCEHDTGFVTNDDYVLAINTGEAKKEGDYEVVELGVSGLDSQMNPITQDKTYIRAGQSTMKTGTQRSFKVSGDRYVGDLAQDFMLAHGMKYGTGNAVVTDYVYFCLLNGIGEKGKASIIVNSDGSGNAGESSAVDIELKKSGSIPEEYKYAASEASMRRKGAEA